MCRLPYKNHRKSGPVKVMFFVTDWFIEDAKCKIDNSNRTI